MSTFNNLEEDILEWTPENACNIGLYYDLKTLRKNSFLAGFNVNYQGQSKINRRYYLDNQSQDWIFNPMRDTVSARLLFNINFKYKTNRLDYGLVVKNLLNKTNFSYLPALASQSGQVMGESRIWYITLKWYLNRKRI